MNAQFDFLAHLTRQAEFSGRVFGPGTRTKGVIDHIKKELVEIEQAPTDITEWIDVVILALDGAWRAGASPQDIIDVLVAKQTRNENRTWPDWRTADPDKAICHVKTVASVASPAQGDSGQWMTLPPHTVAAGPFNRIAAAQDAAEALQAIESQQAKRERRLAEERRRDVDRRVIHPGGFRSPPRSDDMAQVVDAERASVMQPKHADFLG